MGITAENAEKGFQFFSKGLPFPFVLEKLEKIPGNGSGPVQHPAISER